MKKMIFVFIAFVIASGLLLAATEIKAPIDAVTVYMNSAVVERAAKVSLISGETMLMVTDIPSYVDAGSILVSKGSDDSPFLIKEYEFKDVESAVILKDEEKKLRQEYLAAKNKLAAKQDAVKVNDSKVKFLEALSAKRSDEISKELGSTAVTAVSVTEIYKFIADSLSAAYKEKRGLEKEIIDMTNQVKVLESRLSQMQSQYTVSRKVLMIRAESSAAISADIRIKYNVYNAYWVPSYESGLNYEKGEVTTKYYAVISQSTGEEWNDVKLTIATGTPLFDATLPKADPWYVDEIKPVYNYELKAKRAAPMAMKSEAAGAVMAEDAADMAYAAAPAQAPRQIDSIDAGELNLKVNLRGRFSLKNSGETKKVPVTETKLKASEMFYSAVPSKSAFAYLTAEFKNEGDLVILPGETVLYLDGNYAGKAYIENTIKKGEKIKFSFGVDENIKIEKKRQEVTGESGIFGDKKTKTYDVTIKIDNFKGRDVEMFVEEPMPVSKNDRIAVEVIKSAPEITENKEEGIALWKIKVQPQAKSEIKYRIKITQPKDMNTGL